MSACARLGWLVLACVMLAGGTPGCTFQSPLKDARCQSSGDCPKGTRCEEGFCIGAGETWAPCNDLDNDDYFAEEGCGTEVDCDDNNASIFPGAEEKCDLLDNNCDGKKDDPFVQLGTPCSVGTGICANQGELVCNPDGDGTTCSASAGTGREETCNQKDDDCDGEIDNLPGEDPGNQNSDPTNCGQCGTDCTQVFENAIVACEDGLCKMNGCKSPHVDLNGSRTDGCEYPCEGKKIADEKGMSLPSEDTVCNGVDDDCDGNVDEDVERKGKSCEVGRGECKKSGMWVCAQNGGGTICSVQPGSGTSEVCDGKDNDCDGQFDEEPTDGVPWYRDSDGDGYGVASDVIRVCENQPDPAGRSKMKGDCRDNDKDVHPGATERCNRVDDDCDGRTNEGLSKQRRYFDGDGDTFGDSNRSRRTCYNPGPKWIGRGGDCNDSNPNIKPTATEICDGKDNDCRGGIDDNLTRSCGSNTGVCTTGMETCNNGTWSSCSGQTASAEVCDGKDNDCDGRTDEMVGRRNCSKQIGVCSGAKVRCQQGSYPTCGKSEYGQNYEPGGESLCDDGKDNDCDGATDCVDGSEDSDCNCSD